MATITFKELLQSGAEEVLVESYGYTERSSYASHFEPFRNKRTFTFYVTPYGLEHSWLFFENEEAESFTLGEDGKYHCDDPELWARP